MHFEHNQALISSKKAKNIFTVDRQRVNSKTFRDKIEKLNLPVMTKQRLYLEIGRLLEFADGHEEEYLIAISYKDGRLIKDNLNRVGNPGNTGFTAEEYEEVLNSHEPIIVIHNHSYNGLPSAQDMISFHDFKQIALSIIACHSGELYAIFEVTDDMISVYESILAGEKNITSDLRLAKRLATTRLYRLNELMSSKRKMFDVRRL